MQKLSREPAPKPGRVVLQITASNPVIYSLDGVSQVSFDPGEVYEVPQHAAKGMIARKWARELTDDDKRKLGAPKPATEKQKVAATGDDGRASKEEKK